MVRATLALRQEHSLPHWDGVFRTSAQQWLVDGKHCRRVPREVLMKLSSDVRRCREELPEAARRRLLWLITAARRQAAHIIR